MNTLYLQPETDGTAVARAAELLRAGEVVGIPTETVYGLAANALDPDAVRSIFAAKGRPQDNPLIVHIADIPQIYDIAAEVPESALRLAEAFWPGPLTMILPKRERIPMVTSGGLSTVGIRLPSHPLAREIIRAAGVPLAAPSANLSGRPSTTTAQHVLEDLSGKIAAVVEGGACSVGVESTVVSLCGSVPRLLRPGGISLEQLRSVLGEVEVDRALHEKIDDTEKVSAPGMKYRHYAPKAPVTVVLGTPDASADYIAARAESTTGVLCFDDCAGRFAHCGAVFTFGASQDVPEQAREVFDALRRFDETDCTEIFAQCPPSDGIGLAVSNRIQKAAGFHIIDLRKKMKIIGLTGGSGVGKSAACAAFRARGCAVLDADAIYRELCQSCRAMLDQLQNVYGDVLNTDRTLDRKKLGTIVFSDPEKLKLLNSITHPYIRSELSERLRQCADAGCAACICDAPVLFEAGLDTLCDTTVGVLSHYETRLARIMARDGIAQNYAAMRLDAQHDDAWYIRRCGYILHNDGSLEELYAQVNTIFDTIMQGKD